MSQSLDSRSLLSRSDTDAVTATTPAPPSLPGEESTRRQSRRSIGLPPLPTAGVDSEGPRRLVTLEERLAEHIHTRVTPQRVTQARALQHATTTTSPPPAHARASDGVPRTIGVAGERMANAAEAMEDSLRGTATFVPYPEGMEDMCGLPQDDSPAICPGWESFIDSLGAEFSPT